MNKNVDIRGYYVRVIKVCSRSSLNYESLRLLIIPASVDAERVKGIIAGGILK